jgi:thiosulfate/3-mercaptopyruvate sulfurtransferase
MRIATTFALAALLLWPAGCSRSAAPAAGAGAGAAPAAAPAGDHTGHDMTPGAEHRDEPGEDMRHNRHFLMSGESLAARLDRPGTVVIHVGRTDSAYVAGHVPGARFLPLSAVSVTRDGIPNEFPPLEDMRRAFEQLQIGDSARVVLYGDDPLLAARAWVALDLLGQADRAALLDGGLARWRADSRTVDTGPVFTTMIFVPFTARPQPERVVTAEWVRAHLRDTTVLFVDARPADQFGGAEPPCPPAQPACPQFPAARRGHLPGARNLFWLHALVSRENPVLRPMHELHHALWQPLGADRPGVRTVVVYCRSGPQAGHAYFVARYIGYPDVRLYDGSLAEWVRLPAESHPVERTP